MPTDTLLSLAPAGLSDRQFGRFAGPIADLATARWDEGGGVFSRRRLQRKTWTYFGVFSERFMLGFAVVDAGYLGTAFIYLYDRQTKRLIEEKASVPFGFSAGFAGSLGATWALASGGRSWRIAPAGEGWKASFKGKQLAVELTLGGGPGMSTLAPSLRRPFHYTYKICGMPVAAQVEAHGERHAFNAEGMIDFTLGYPPRHTTWNWASMTGRDEQGGAVGLNVVAHFTNGLENGLWLDGAVVPLAQATFEYDPADVLQPWRVRTEDGRVDLRFLPEGKRSEKLSVGLLVSDFAQPFGRFEGEIEHGGRRRRVTGLGVTEEHLAVW